MHAHKPEHSHLNRKCSLREGFDALFCRHLSRQLKSAIQEQRSAADEIITAEREELQELARIHRQRMEMELAELQAANMEIEEEEAMGSMSESSLHIQLALEAMKQQMEEMQALQESMMERIAAGDEEGEAVDFTESMQQAVQHHVRCPSLPLPSQPSFPPTRVSHFWGIVEFFSAMHISRNVDLSHLSFIVHFQSNGKIVNKCIVIR
jgi:hypothetical protein